MKCIIPGTNVKLLGKAIHSLAKVGNELYVEPQHDSLTLRSVNSSRSAYMCFTLNIPFFIEYHEEEGAVCKVPVKSCVLAFKSFSGLEKVEKCIIQATEAKDQLVFQLYYKHDMVKTYNIPFIEYETLKATFKKDGYPNTIFAKSKLLSDGLLNFHQKVEEITLLGTQNKVTLKTYVDDEPDPTKVVHTEVCLDTAEFDGYTLKEESTLTFCLKEVRALLYFTDGLNFPINILFGSPGKPIFFSVQNLPELDVDLVLATLEGPESSESSQESVVQTKSAVITHRQNSHAKETTQKSSSNKSKGNTASSELDKPVETEKARSQWEDEVENDYFCEQNGNGNDMALTPPSKRTRSVFLGLSQVSNCPSMFTGQDEVLAEETDDEDNCN